MLTVSFATHDRPPAVFGQREVNVWRDDQGQVFARGYSSGDSHRIEWPGLGTFTFGVGSSTITIWLASGARRDVAEDAVTRVLQPMMLQALGWQALHASGVVCAGAVVAFCGRSGNGKSTLAYALATRGFPQFSDDAVLLDVSADAVVAVPLAFTPRLRPPARAHMVAPPAPAGALSPAPLGAIVILEQQSMTTPPSVEPVPAVAAFAALVTHAHCFDPAPGPGTRTLVSDFLTVADRVPVFRLSYAPGLQTLDGVVDAALEAARRAGLDVPVSSRTAT